MSGLLFRPLRQIADRFNTLQMGMVSTERIFKILEDNSNIKDEGVISKRKFEGMIEFKDVTFSYVKNELVINNISFKINPGETFAIVGPTGAGKTTITNLITRFYEHEEGKVLLDGYNINDFELKNIRDQVGIILQDVFLFADTIFNNIALYNNKISLEDVQNAAKKLEIHDFINSLPNGYDFKVSENPKKDENNLDEIIESLRISVRPLTKEDIKNRKLPNQTTGLVITNMANNSPLVNSIEINSIIIEAQKKKIKSADDLRDITQKAINSNQKTILIAIYNNQNQRRYIGVKLD